MIIEQQRDTTRDLDSITFIPPVQSFRDPSFLTLLDECWRLVPPPATWDVQFRGNGKDHVLYTADVRKAARRHRDVATPDREGWTS